MFKDRWLSAVDDQSKEQIKIFLLMTIASPEREANKGAARVSKREQNENSRKIRFIYRLAIAV